MSQADDRMLVARISGIARRHARYGGLTEAEEAAGAAELRQVAAGRNDLLAQEAGIELGFAESRGDQERNRAEQIARLCRLAGADEELVPQWIETGRRRAEERRMPPFSDPSPRTPRRSRTSLFDCGTQCGIPLRIPHMGGLNG